MLATGGYGADYGEDSILKKHRPDILHLPTTNGVCYVPFLAIVADCCRRPLYR